MTEPSNAVLAEQIRRLQEEFRDNKANTKEELKELVSDNQTIELKTNLLTENFEKNLKEQFPQATFRIDEEILTISMSKSEEPLANIFAIAAASNVVITSAIVKVPSLEDVFLHLTGKALRD